MKAGDRGLAKNSGGKTVKMTVEATCPKCGKTYAIKSDVPMRDQAVCDACK